MERVQPGLARVRRARWTAAGRSAHPDACTAGTQAASVALAGRRAPGLLLVFASAAYDLPALVTGIVDVAGDVPMVGCSSSGELDSGGRAAHSVVVLALGGDGLSFSTAAVAGADPRDAGARAAACLGDLASSAHRVLVLLADDGAGDPAEIVRGAYSVAGAGVPLAGGVAGTVPGSGPQAGGVLHDGRVLRDAVVGVAIGSDAPLGVGARHGLRPIGAPMLVSRAAPGRVLELDGRSADQVYRERLGLDGARATGFIAAHPLGLRRRVGESHLRSVTLDDAGDGGIGCSVPAGALVWLMDGAVDAVLDAIDAACDEAISALDGHDPLALVVFDCQARRAAVSLECAREELARLQRHAGAAALVGAGTRGEIARRRGSAGFHDQTLVVLAVA